MTAVELNEETAGVAGRRRPVLEAERPAGLVRHRPRPGARRRRRHLRAPARARSSGLVGESGCGKSTLGRGLLGLLPDGAARDGELASAAATC